MLQLHLSWSVPWDVATLKEDGFKSAILVVNRVICNLFASGTKMYLFPLKNSRTPSQLSVVCMELNCDHARQPCCLFWTGTDPGNPTATWVPDVRFLCWSRDRHIFRIVPVSVHLSFLWQRHNSKAKQICWKRSPPFIAQQHLNFSSTLN